MTNCQLIGEAVFNLRVHAFFVFLGVANCQGRRRQRICLHPPLLLDCYNTPDTPDQAVNMLQWQFA